MIFFDLASDMWFNKLLKGFLTLKVDKNEHNYLIESIDAAFAYLVWINQNQFPQLDTVLRILSYMVRLYKEKTSQPALLIVDDLNFAVTIAEKTTTDHGLWLGDFYPLFDINDDELLIDLLRVDEFYFLNNKLNWEIDFRPKDIIYLFKTFPNPGIAAEFKFHALHLKLAEQPEDHLLIDKLIFHPLITQCIAHNHSKPSPLRKAASLISDKNVFNDLARLDAPPNLIPTILTIVDETPVQSNPSTTLFKSNDIAEFTQDISKNLEAYFFKERCSMKSIFSVLINTIYFIEEYKLNPDNDKPPMFYSALNRILFHCLITFELCLPQANHFCPAQTIQSL